MRTTEAKLVVINTTENSDQIVTGYRCKGCVGKSVRRITCPNLTMPADDQELISAKVSGGGKPNFRFIS